MSDKKDSRRQFLKNTTLTALGLGALPLVSSELLANGNGPEACEKTTLDYYGEGPFYTQNPPTIQSSQLADAGETGTRMIISGRVMTPDCTQVIPNTVVDVWHADDAGDYDNQGYNLRGKTTSNSQGFYVFETIKPGKYLNGAQFRPSHIHFKITPPGGTTLTTQLYFQGDTDIPNDAAASITSGQYDATHRTIPLSTNGQGKLEGTWDIVIDGQGISTGMQDMHVDKGMIYEASPNPFSREVEIRYGVFRESKVSLSIYDLQGNEVATLEENNLAPEKYTAVWQPPSDLPNGHYFFALKVNDLQVHYLRVMKQG